MNYNKPLKNNEERCAFIRDESNWDIVSYIGSLQYASDEENIESALPSVRLRRLNRTNIYEVQVMSSAMYCGDKPHYVTIRTMHFDNRGILKSIYDLTPNQIIAYLREKKL